ncbi:hypothetical protein IL306_004080 [Fusarium sp. DS 682]|nr:hypothetical protein IL306_004080 [Fusarium sp. DS 682]
MRELQARLDDRLTKAADEVPENLEHINDFLGKAGENSFLKQLAQRSFDDSPEFRIFYLRARTAVYSYWTIVGRAIELLQMATKAPNVHFYEGEKTTTRYLAYLGQQHELFESCIGKATIDLVDCVSKDGPLQGKISLATNTGAGIERCQVIYEEGYLAQTSTQLGPWHMGAFMGTKGEQGSLKFDWFGECSYSFQETASGHYLITINYKIKYGIQMSPLPVLVIGPKTEYWYVKPVAPGSDRFIIPQVEEPGWKIATDSRTLKMDQAFACSNTDRLFQVRPC